MICLDIIEQISHKPKHQRTKQNRIIELINERACADPSTKFRSTAIVYWEGDVVFLYKYICEEKLFCVYSVYT